MSQDTFGRTNEIGTPSLLGSQSDDNAGGVGQCDLRGHGCPATEGRTLEPKEEEDLSKEALDIAGQTDPLA